MLSCLRYLAYAILFTLSCLGYLVYASRLRYLVYAILFRLSVIVECLIYVAKLLNILFQIRSFVMMMSWKADVLRLFSI